MDQNGTGLEIKLLKWAVLGQKVNGLGQIIQVHAQVFTATATATTTAAGHNQCKQLRSNIEPL